VNYFEFYGLPVSFLTDQEQLKKKFFEHSRSYHPDFHTLASEEHQATALEKSTLNNQAYRVLSDFDQRMKYILDLFGKLKEEGENKVPDDFLMEMMELNEGVMELEMQPSLEKKEDLIQQIDGISQEAIDEIKELLVRERIDELQEAEWSLISAYYLKNRYLRRLRENIQHISDNL
jgi:molecular chaperone HscB